MIPYRLLPPAEEEMIEAALFYEAAAGGLGDDFLDDVQHAIDSVRDHPELASIIAYGFRRVLVRRFPFSIIYAASACRRRCCRPPTPRSGLLERTHVTANFSSSGRRGSVSGLPVTVLVCERCRACRSTRR